MKHRLPNLPILLGLPALLGLALATVAVIASQQPPPQAGGGVIYSVAQVRQNLIQNPNAWRGREVLVRGTAVGAEWATGPADGRGAPCAPPNPPCPVRLPSGRVANVYPIDGVMFSCTPPKVCTFPVPTGRVAHISLVDDSQYRPHNPTPNQLVLRLAPAPPDPLRTFLRRLPGIGALLSSPSPPRSVAMRGGVSHIYRVHLLGLEYSLCSPGTLCDNAALLDAQP